MYTPADLALLLDNLRPLWRAPTTLTFTRFAATMLTMGVLRNIELRRLRTDDSLTKLGLPWGRIRIPAPEREPLTRYVSGEPSLYAVALSLRARAYLSHATAAYLHQLFPEDPVTVYVNREQAAKPGLSAVLSQHAMDLAFRRPQRRSKDVYSYEGRPILLLSGKHTGQLGVVSVADQSGRQVPATSLERTLVDLAVRPGYCGGATHVLEAYRAASGRASLDALTDILVGLRHAYPYHQAVGFYLQRAGWLSQDLTRLRALGLTFDFYLEHAAPHTQYDAHWRVHFPEGL